MNEWFHIAVAVWGVLALIGIAIGVGMLLRPIPPPPPPPPMIDQGRLDAVIRQAQKLIDAAEKHKR